MPRKSRTRLLKRKHGARGGHTVGECLNVRDCPIHSQRDSGAKR